LLLGASSTRTEWRDAVLGIRGGRCDWIWRSRFGLYVAGNKRRRVARSGAHTLAFLEDWRRQGPAFPEQTLAVHPRVQSASGALRAAYQTLIARYPEQGASNKDAFFDYHCALDFL
jgi:hypothetical protein